MTRNTQLATGFLVVLAAVAIKFLWSQLPAIGAGGLLHPARRRDVPAAPSGCIDTTFTGAGVRLRGWRCAATATSRRGSIVYLHGIADNRSSAAGVIPRFTSRGFDVVAYDSRAHGQSDGEVCTYGFFEKDDLRAVVATLAPGPVVLIGTSLGAAVALQEAADDRRVSAVVAAETFSDLRTVAAERAPFVFTAGVIRRAFALAAEQGRFDVDAVSPRAAAARITAPALIIHGAADVDTPPAHSQRVYDALRGPKQLLLVPGVGHNESLGPDVWRTIEDWIDRVMSSADGAAAAIPRRQDP